MPLPPTTDTAEQFARKLTVRLGLGAALVFGLTFLLCLPSMPARIAAGLSLFTAFWAGPFLGGALTVISYSRPRQLKSATVVPASHPGAGDS